MIAKTYVNFSLNTFLKNIFLKKQYLQNLKKHFNLIENKKKNSKLVYEKIKKKIEFYNDNNLIMYIIDITFTNSNTFLHVMDSSGKLLNFFSAGCFNIKGKNKKSRFNVFKHFYFILTTRLGFLKNKPLALHLKNVGFNKFWIIKKLKTKFFIKLVKVFNLFPFNGCRKKKIRRKKL